jgi:hypothetical protein
MSTLNVSNITDGTDTVETGYVLNGSAKAWVNFNGTGTIAARDSLNVSSLSDDATGNYDVNFTSAFANADYSGPYACGYGAAVSNNDVHPSSGFTVANTSSFSNVGVINGARSTVDVSYVTGTFTGDLA